MWHNLERVQKNIRQANKKGTQRKDGTQNGTYGIALDLISKPKNNTTETNCCGPECLIFTDLCWAGLLIFASENLYSNKSRSQQNFGVGFTPNACTI